jgi:hypothetical protein
MKFVLSVLVVFIAGVQSVYGCENPKVEYGLYTHHLVSDRQKVNEVNEFIGVQCGGWQFATFQNSYKGFSEDYDATTFALGYSFDVTRNFNMSVGVFTGYKEKIEFMPKQIYIGVGDLIWYRAPQVLVWGDQLVPHSVAQDHRWSESVALGARLHGEVFSMSLVTRW